MKIPDLIKLIHMFNFYVVIQEEQTEYTFAHSTSLTAPSTIGTHPTHISGNFFNFFESS